MLDHPTGSTWPESQWIARRGPSSNKSPRTVLSWLNSEPPVVAAPKFHSVGRKRGFNGDGTTPTGTSVGREATAAPGAKPSAKRTSMPAAVTACSVENPGVRSCTMRSAACWM